MKSTFLSILGLAILAYTSCERHHEKPAPGKPDPAKLAQEKPSPGKSDSGRIQESIPRADNADSSGDPDEMHAPPIVSPATLNRLLKEADEAFSKKDYSTAAARCEELLKKLGPRGELQHEMLYFNIGLSKLLDGKYSEAETALKDCIKRFPKGEYTSRAYIGLGRACIMQDLPEKKEEALEALNKAAADPKCKAEADLWRSRMSQSPAGP